MTDVDVAIIGSGAGGLTAAVALAQAGKKVAVFEQHYLPGGWCHSFTLEGYRFSPGVHYIGELGPGGRMRQIYEGLGLGPDLEFCELNPDGFDHIRIGPDFVFDIPRGREAFTERLASRFPHEARGIDGYLRDVESMGRELYGIMHYRGAKSLMLPIVAPTVTRWGLRPAAKHIAHHVKDPYVRAIFSAQSGDHGLPPSMIPAAVHASITAHYYNGGWYPRGGASSLPRAFIRALRKAGGEIHVKTPVNSILLDGDRAVGLRLADGRDIRATHVISNADPEVTFGRLIGRNRLPKTLRARLERTKYSTSCLSLFFAVDMDLRAAGLDSGNQWYYTTPDVEGTYRAGLTAWGPEVKEIPGGFLTCTTLKDPSKAKKGEKARHHTLEAFAFVGYDAWSQWENSECGSRPAAYEARKEAVKQRMLEMVNRIVPGIRDHVVFSDLGTPLTNVHYCGATRGNLYGTEKTVGQIGPFGWQIGTPFDGLYLCGASTLGHGVAGATLSGLAVARKILRCSNEDLLRHNAGELRVFPSEQPETWCNSAPAHGEDAAE